LAISVAAAAGIALLLLAPFPAPSFSPGWTFAVPLDKFVHFALFLLAVLPWRRSMSAFGFSFPDLATLIFATLYAGLIELLQGAVTSSRVAESGDLFAGALGALTGLLAARCR
jgi:hypothetical protein